MNGANVVVDHITYTGPDNNRTMFAAAFEQEVLSETAQGTPFDLNDPDFGHLSTSIDSSKLNPVIK